MQKPEGTRPFENVASPITIATLWFHDIPQDLQFDGTVVGDDVFAFTTNAAILLSKNPRRLVVVNEDSLGRARGVYRDAVLVGESDRLPPQEFVCSNQLADMVGVVVAGRDVLWMSVNGSRVFEQVWKQRKDAEILSGSFYNVGALTTYLRGKGGSVHIIMAGNRGAEVGEDRICADVIEKRLSGQEIDWDDVKRGVSASIRKGDYQPADAERNLPVLLDLVDKSSIIPVLSKNDDGFLQFNPIVEI